jgi:hypothetical protein
MVFRGLICKDPINMGNPLFQLPLKIVIDKEKALEVSSLTTLFTVHECGVKHSPCTSG